MSAWPGVDLEDWCGEYADNPRAFPDYDDVYGELEREVQGGAESRNSDGYGGPDVFIRDSSGAKR